MKTSAVLPCLVILFLLHLLDGLLVVHLQVVDVVLQFENNGGDGLTKGGWGHLQWSQHSKLVFGMKPRKSLLFYRD